MSNCIKNKRKLIKGQHPLKNCTFYLDIGKHSASDQIEEKINDLGGKIEFFFSERITHVITDRNTNKEVVANSFNSQLSSGECLTKTNEIRTRSRADEMLQRVRSASQIQQDSPINNLLINNKYNIKSPSIQQQQQIKFNLKETRIWNANHALNILNKLINEKKQRQEEKSSVIKILHNSSNSATTTKSSKSLKDSFIKIESFEKIYRPYYKTFIKWPKINIKLNKTSSLFNYMDNNCLNKLIYQHEKNFQNEKSEQNRKQQEGNNLNFLKKPNFEEIKKQNNTNNRNNNYIINSDTITSVAKNGLRRNNNKNFSPPALSAATAANDNEGGEKFLLQQINDEKLLIRDKSAGVNCVDNKSRNNSFNNLNKTFTSTINDNLKNNKCGFCELCKIEYENLNKHLKSDEHVKFSENSKNYSELDKIILDSGLNFEAFKKKEGEELKSFFLINNTSSNICQSNFTKINQYQKIKDENQTSDYTANSFEEVSESFNSSQKGLKHKIVKFTQKIKPSHEQNELKLELEKDNFQRRIKLDCSPIRNSPEKNFLEENLQSEKLKEERGQNIHSPVATCTSSSILHNHIKLSCNNFFLKSNPTCTDNIHPTLKRRENFLKNPAIKLKNCRVNLTRQLDKVTIFKFSPTLKIKFSNEKLESKLANSSINTCCSTIQETKFLRNTRKNKEPKFYLEYSSSDDQPLSKIKKTNNKRAVKKVTNNTDKPTIFNKNCFKMTKFNGANKRLPRKSPLKAGGDEKIMFGDDLCIKNGYRETRQSICKRNSYSADSIKKVEISVKQKLNTVSSPKSPLTSFINTRPKKSSTKKISYCEVDDDIEDFIIGTPGRTKSSIPSAVHTKIFTKKRRRKKQELKSMKAKRNNSNNAYYKVVDNKSSPPKRSLESVAKSPNKKEVNFPTKLGIVGQQTDSKLNVDKKPSIIVKFKKVRKSELSILNGEAENFMFPKRMERKRKHSSSANESSDEEILPLPSKRVYGKSPKINNMAAAIISPNKNRSIIQFSSTTSEKKPFVPKVRSNFLSGDIAKFNFAFERVPKDELWYSVFERQDDHKEVIFEYYGNTKYRKLPFEMGPVSALESRDHCFACNLAQSCGTAKKSKTKNVPTTISSQQVQEVKCKSEIEDNDDKNISINSVDNEIFKSKSSKSTIKKLLKRDSTKSILENFDIPRKSPREHASTLAILSCLINNKFSDTDENSGSHSLVNTNLSCSSNNKSPKSIPESQILDYKRKSKKTLKLATAILQKTLKSEVSAEKKIDNESAMAIKTNVTQDTSLPLPRRRSKLNPTVSTAAMTKLSTKRSKKPLHWKKRACMLQNLNDVQNKEIYANPIKLNKEIDTFLDITLKAESFETSSLPSMVSSNEINFRNMLSLDDLMNDSLLKQQASYFNKLNFVKKRKHKNNNTGWPKNKKKIVTRQQKRKSSHTLEIEKSVNKNIIEDKEKIISCVSVPGENEESIENFEECSEDNVTTLFDDDTVKNEENDEFLSAESNLEDEVNSIPSTPDEVCKTCELYVCECVAIQKSSMAPLTSDIPNKLDKIGSPSSSIKISPRKLRKPRGRWYRER